MSTQSNPSPSAAVGIEDYKPDDPGFGSRLLSSSCRAVAVVAICRRHDVPAAGVVFDRRQFLQYHAQLRVCRHGLGMHQIITGA
jgi:hypothetical protein